MRKVKVVLTQALILITLFGTPLQCAKILGIFWVPSLSHHLVYQPFCKELSLKGHDVVVISPNPMNDTSLINLTEINIDYVYKHSVEIELMDANSYVATMSFVYPWFTKVFIDILKDKNVMKLLDEDEKFDLVIVEGLSPLAFALANKFGAPVISITSIDSFYINHYSVGNTLHPALFGESIMPFAEKPLSIWTKLTYAYYFIWNWWFLEYTIMPSENAIAQTYLGKNTPPVKESTKNLALYFVNRNLVVHGSRPFVPAVVPINFLHIKPTKPLPKDLKEILDTAPHGVVYFSLGSNVKSSNLPKKMQDIIIQALSELPYSVLWKFETDEKLHIGKNIYMRKWFPQQDVLAHKNLRVFVTQGGAQSAEEAIYNEVPLVGIPFIGDQIANIKNLANKGAAIYVDHRTMTKGTLKSAIMKIASNKSYSQSMKIINDVLKDEPMTSLEKAVWWSEYVIRHKGSPFRRSPTLDSPLIEYLMLDIIGVVLGIILAIVIGFKLGYFLIKRLFVKEVNKKLKFN